MKRYFIWPLAMIMIGFLLQNCEVKTTHNEQGEVEMSPVNQTAQEEPINDAEWLKDFEKKASAYYAENGGTDADTYKKQLLTKKCAVNCKPPLVSKVQGSAFYQQFKPGVLMMGKMYKCPNCPDDHISTASAFVISEDGICATNYHVFKSYDPSKPNEYITYYVMDVNSNIYPVVEVLAASKHDDLAIFRIDTKGTKMSPLALGNEKGTGEPIHLISHPDHRFYTYTQGFINRKYIKPGTTKIRQCISAEFAKGSSGAPVMDECGNVVGVVAGTQNIYYDQEAKVYQTTIHEIIPVSRLKELIN
jgi:S1-C subfamily serine protease